jgi:uncharacterized membrane protein HdeD (DUF308 family)
MDFGLARNWWLLALRGVLAIAFGILAFFWPAMLLLAVVYIFAAYALLDGIFAVVAAISGHREIGQWWALWLEGFIGIAAGLLAFLWPGITELLLIFLIAYWSIATGIFEIVAAIRLRRHIRGEFALILGGILSILFGLALLFWPVAGLLAVAWLIGAYGIIFGVLMLALAWRVRSWHHLSSRGF